MRITVITVCYNSAAHIAGALASLDAQRWPDIEHIVVDGASADATLAVLAAHARPWRHVVSEPDRGIYDAMNKGLARATGDVIGFLNADDCLADPLALSRVAQACLAGARAVYGDLQYVTAGGRVLRHWRSGGYHPRRLAWGWMPPHPTFYAHRTCFEALGGFDADFRIAGDYELMLRFLRRGGVQPVYLPQVQVRMLSGGVSNRSPGSLLRKSGEDLRALRRHHAGGWLTLLAKNLRKLPQFLARPTAGGQT